MKSLYKVTNLKINLKSIHIFFIRNQCTERTKETENKKQMVQQHSSEENKIKGKLQQFFSQKLNKHA